MPSCTDAPDYHFPVFRQKALFRRVLSKSFGSGHLRRSRTFPGIMFFYRTECSARTPRGLHVQQKKSPTEISALCISVFLAGMTVSACNDDGTPLPDTGNSAALRKSEAPSDVPDALPENYRLDPFRPRSEKRSEAAPEQNAAVAEASGSGLPEVSPAFFPSKNSGIARTSGNDSGKKAWTIMVYMSGDNNLEGQSFQEILEMVLYIQLFHRNY